MRAQIEGAAGDFSEQVYADRGLAGLFGPPAYAVTDASAFGNTASGADCHAAWGELTDAAGLAASRLLHALHTDGHRLDQVIFSFQTTDHETADLVNSAGAPLTFISSHVHHNQDGLPDELNDQIRGDQLDEVVDHAAGIDGPVIVGSDDNTTSDPDEFYDFEADGPAALDRYGSEGFQDVGDVGPTVGDRTIDHIHARGVPASVVDPTRVDGGPSDHDGQSVSYYLTDW